MPHHLDADFEIELPQPFLVEGEGHGDIHGDWQIPKEVAIQEFVLSAFSCRVEFVPNESFPSSWSADHGAIFAVSKVRLRISREERVHPPEIVESESGGRDFSLRAKYFDERISEYVGTARQLTDRIIKFSRYRLGMYGARDVSHAASASFDNPEWFFNDEGPIDPGLRRLTVRMAPTETNSWGVSVLRRTASHHPMFNFLGVPEVPLHRELQALGKDAAFVGDLRRAVVELAIACEVAVKQAFFAPDSAASEAFEFLEEKQKVEVTVIELLKQPAERAFGTKFTDVDAAAAGRLEALFRCRNKVAHRGSLVYRDSKGNLRSADGETVRAWWEATEVLLNWLETKCGLGGIRGL